MTQSPSSNTDSNTIKTALITGASAGIGLEFAHVFAEKGYDIILVARREDKLTDLSKALRAKHGVLTHVIPTDLSDPASPQALYQAVKDKGLHVDALVNNAGFAISGNFLETEWKQQAALLQVLNTSLVELCHLFAPDMKQKQRGHIINVASVAAFLPQVSGSLYSAAKTFVVCFTQAINLELKPHGVHCTALCPGLTRSDFFDNIGGNALTKHFPKLLWMSSRQVAEEGFEAAMKEKTLHINGRLNAGLSQLMMSVPMQAKDFIAKKLPSFETLTKK